MPSARSIMSFVSVYEAAAQGDRTKALDYCAHDILKLKEILNHVRDDTV